MNLILHEGTLHSIIKVEVLGYITRTQEWSGGNGSDITHTDYIIIGITPDLYVTFCEEWSEIRIFKIAELTKEYEVNLIKGSS